MAPDLARAIVCRPPQDGRRQWKLEDIEVYTPAEGEVLVKIIASGVCHTDLGCGSFPDGVGFPVPPYPRVLGHEGAGYVTRVGKGVTKVKPGDSVLLSFAYCGECHNCRNGAPGYCAEFTPLNFCGNPKAFGAPNSKESHGIGGSFFGQSSFSNLTRVQEASVVRVTDLVKNEDDLKLFAPLGCGIQAARHRGCRTIIGIDRVEARLDLARSLGATHTINTSTVGEGLEKAVRDITDGSGSTITVDATGVVALIQQGIEFTANQGKMILLGVAPMDAALQVALVSFMVVSESPSLRLNKSDRSVKTGKQLLGSMEGGVRPADYVPRMIQWYRHGDFPIDKLIKYYKVEEFEQAIHDMEEGTTVKPILLW
ncbi:hypothetical protein H2204_008674 [Knufia peltigerae]|uniref:Enoyl reductase (ER) domain-containing protein n=1 Tax=Knufia peltigerae TaxID=1002370 RepID=A0AA39CWP8_9EURO|nr:hypothetical protein H2204_008674 [Knufia peltigerae]